MTFWQLDKGSSTVWSAQGISTINDLWMSTVRVKSTSDGSKTWLRRSIHKRRPSSLPARPKKSSLRLIQNKSHSVRKCHGDDNETEWFTNLSLKLFRNRFTVYRLFAEVNYFDNERDYNTCLRQIEKHNNLGSMNFCIIQRGGQHCYLFTCKVQSTAAIF